MRWDPDQYDRFADDRLRPARELLDRVPLEHSSLICDLGCGNGNVTPLIKERWPEARLIGVDRSPEMLAEAEARLGGVEWVEADIATWREPAPLDLLFSNAALHWLDDHETLFPRLAAMLEPGGVLAVQMPRNAEAPSHLCLDEAARTGPWREKLEGVRRRVIAGPAFYHDLLAPHARRLDIWETEYLHVLEGEDPVVAWTAGSALRPYLAPLDAAERAGFTAAYRACIARAYPRRADGRTLFPFRRLFIVAMR